MSNYFGLDTLGAAFVSPFVGPDSSAPRGGAAPAAPVAQTDEQEWFGDFTQGLAQEGLMGVFDVAGMLDRQAAQRELAGQFDIKSAGDRAAMTGDVAGNVVTPEEFQKIAKTYSDIRLDRTDIHLDPSGMTDATGKDEFRNDVMGDIGNLLQTNVGRELVGNLANQKDDRKTRIEPRLVFGELDRSRASGGGDPAATTGSPIDKVGMDAQIRYVPGDDGGVDVDSKQKWMPMRSDITLFHELTHAYRATLGTFEDDELKKKELVHKKDDGAKKDEYAAIGLGAHANDSLTENAYRAERAKIGDGVGARTTGGVADKDIVLRDRYAW
ncbi:MAG: M91 family zinc metallopeptidase [Kofleriaceae bacterium]